MQNFYKIFKIFKSLWWVHFCWMSLPNQNFGDAIAVQDLSGIYVWNFVRFFHLEPKFLSRYWYNCTLYITVVLGQYSIWTSGKWECSFMYVLIILILLWTLQYKFYNTLIAGLARAGNFGPVDASIIYFKLIISNLIILIFTFLHILVPHFQKLLVTQLSYMKYELQIRVCVPN